MKITINDVKEWIHKKHPHGFDFKKTIAPEKCFDMMVNFAINQVEKKELQDSDIGMKDKFWVSIYDCDAFSGIEVNKKLEKYIKLLEGNTTEVIDIIFDHYDEYRSYEVEYTSQARHGSNGTEEINTLEELKDYFSWVGNINEIL